ncbi:hypothetical protein CIL05_07325 [Virgibacillus profundi]|uniref:Uncharacterized protein n=1 Tax=Virgibacillus profundi TaxID=2024555 RepID=A0A2A2IE37_9BACI|nr:hypothetical protein [Virgibacillus profundi]PAV30271.1 hypothetical protein CIL05_07325 [Virgibacillus profundi]PXY54443.1 hypothetical protein CIT14_07410 [Virgibacillus profundi]
MVLESASKMMFYPTDEKIIYRMIGVLGRLSVSAESRTYLQEYLGKTTYQQQILKAMDTGVTNPMTIMYDYLLNQGDLETIHKCFNVAFGYSSKQTITIADLFAGEGKWLELFKSAIPHEELGAANLHLIANELETNRYNKIKDNELIDESYNGTFEEFNQLPQGSISLMLYNPPYGDTNQQRNVKHYLQMIVDEKLLFNSKGSNHTNDNGKIVMVIRKDDVLDSLPLIVEHFHVEKEHLYKVNKEEYAKYKQFVVYAELRKNPLNKGNVTQAMVLQQEVKEISDIVNSNPEFNVKMYDMRRFYIPEVPYSEMKRNHKVVLEANYHNSNLNNDNWNWIKEMTEVKDMGESVIMKPTKIKSGELANIIASGMINGDMEINGKGKHIVAGGMKQKIHEEETTEELANGEEQVIKKKMLYSEPYLNVLVSKNGKAKVKELSGGTGGDLE